MSELVKYSEQTFESIKHVNEYGEEYWLARELQGVLEYARWENFNKAIERAKKACTNTGFDVEDHFREVTKMVPLGSGAEREIDDVMLSRYACYLVVMNGDPSKEVTGPLCHAEGDLLGLTGEQQILSVDLKIHL